jgi:hypothetical protein
MITPPPEHVVVGALPVSMTSPVGMLSVHPTPVSVVPEFGLLIVNVMDVVPFSTIELALNAFASVGGCTAAAATPGAPSHHIPTARPTTPQTATWRRQLTRHLRSQPRTPNTRSSFLDHEPQECLAYSQPRAL